MITEVSDEGNQSFEYEETEFGAWKLLVYWLLYRRLPGKEYMTLNLLINSWALGEKVEIPDFRDDIMVHLMRLFDSGEAEVTPETLRQAFCITIKQIADRSKLRILFSEEAIKTRLLTCENDIYDYELDKCYNNHLSYDIGGWEY